MLSIKKSTLQSSEDDKTEEEARCSSQNPGNDPDSLHNKTTQSETDRIACGKDTAFVDPNVENDDNKHNEVVKIKTEPIDANEETMNDEESNFVTVYIEPEIDIKSENDSRELPVKIKEENVDDSEVNQELKGYIKDEVPVDFDDDDEMSDEEAETCEVRNKQHKRDSSLIPQKNWTKTFHHKEQYILPDVDLKILAQSPKVKHELEDIETDSTASSSQNNSADDKTKKKSFTCTYCVYKTSHKGHLTEHINSKHTKSHSFQCTYCSYITYRKADLNRHVNSKHTRSTSFNCSYCSFKSYDRSTLDTHVNAKHTKRTTFSCSYCTYKTFQKGNLSQHINAVHTKSTSFDCSYCSFRAYDRNTIHQHVNAKHTKSISFDCTYCSYKTYDKAHLSRHVNAKHTKNTSFDCTHCSYKSFYRSDLNKHIRVRHKDVKSSDGPVVETSMSYSGGPSSILGTHL